jgi:hypothetical protein
MQTGKSQFREAGFSALRHHRPAERPVLPPPCFPASLLTDFTGNRALCGKAPSGFVKNDG